MQLTVSYEEHVLQVEVDGSDPIENVKAIIEAEVGDRNEFCQKSLSSLAVGRPPRFTGAACQRQADQFQRHGV